MSTIYYIVFTRLPCGKHVCQMAVVEVLTADNYIFIAYNVIDHGVFIKYGYSCLFRPLEEAHLYTCSFLKLFSMLRNYIHKLYI